MIELIQFPWSPFCIVQRRILEFAEVKFRLRDIPNTDRSLVWKLTRERYYQVPVLKDGPQVIFETSETSQVIAKYLDQKFQLGLFPPETKGVQSILWQYVEDQIEGLGFKLCDIYFEEHLPKQEHLAFIRHKERKFGRGCIRQWEANKDVMLAELAQKLMPFEQMLETRPFLLAPGPQFIDFDLYGMLANFLYPGRHPLPPEHRRLAAWYQRMSSIQRSELKS
jgi:glutathione S-transferase